MVFSSFAFIFCFLPVVLLGYFLLSKVTNRKGQHIFLILASLFFYAYDDIIHPGKSGMPHVVVLVLSIVVNFICASFIEKSNKSHSPKGKVIFIFSVLFNVILLGYYKYTNFVLENINIAFTSEFTLHKIILPLGISFFTFQQLAYQISIWKKEEKVPGFIDYSLFIAFFPQLVAGPIVFSKDVMSQYQDEKNRFFNSDNFSKGIYIFCIGLFKKAVLADSLINVVGTGFDTGVHQLSFGGAWLSSIAYTLQIYFDFSGYSDMAIGLAKMMNINLPINFYSPYISKSITEFWKRWHISLGRSLAVLVYYPLGGNRKGKVRTCINLFAVFLVSGIWHGAAWTFVVWGVMHGTLRVIEKIFENSINKIPGIIRLIFIFLFVNTAWVFFRASTVKDAFTIIKKMFIPDSISFDGINRLVTDGILTYPDTIQIAYILTFVVVLLFIAIVIKKNSIDLYERFSASKGSALFTSVLFCVSVLHLSKAGAFIYFNF